MGTKNDPERCWTCNGSGWISTHVTLSDSRCPQCNGLGYHLVQRRGGMEASSPPCDPKAISFDVAEDGSSITFQPCGFTSHNPNDVEGKYCVRCHRFMDLVMAVRYVKKEMFP